MPGSVKKIIIPDELLMNKIYLIRGQKVMLDNGLSALYQVETRRLNEQVTRNKERFPEDFMFQLTRNEYENLISQIATSSLATTNAGWGGRRKLPYAFTEQGVAMLSSVLNSQAAISVNIQIIRVFTKMRELLMAHKDILLQLEKMEKNLSNHDEQITLIFSYLKKLLNPAQPPRQRIGFRRKDEED